MLPQCYIPPIPAPLFTACFSWLPAENLGTVVAGICTRSVGFLGLTPWRAARAWVVNFPNPVNDTSPPERRTSVISQERVHRFRSVTLRALPCPRPVDELLFCHVHPPLTLPVSLAAAKPFRLNHAFCGGFLRRQQLSCPKKRHKTGSAARQSVGSALLAVEHADRDSALQAGFADGIEGLDDGSAGGDDVLYEAHALPRLEDAFEAVRRAVLLRRLAHDQEREPGGHRRRGSKRDRSELRARETNRVGLVLGHGGAMWSPGRTALGRVSAVLSGSS